MSSMRPDVCSTFAVLFVLCINTTRWNSMRQRICDHFKRRCGKTKQDSQLYVKLGVLCQLWRMNSPQSSGLIGRLEGFEKIHVLSVLSLCQTIAKKTLSSGETLFKNFNLIRSSKANWLFFIGRETSLYAQSQSIVWAASSWSPNSTDLYFWYLFVVNRQIQKT